jgi:hypothetical protein
MMKFLGFKENGKRNSFYAEGAATVQIGAVVREVPASDWGDHITVHGLAVKYRTGTKIWSGHAEYWKASGEFGHISGGLDNRQRNGIASLVGFYEDVTGTSRSMRESTR